ncbi:MAG: 4Fe-4S binding protein [Deltaproteobacteria bacterium]|nr:4Fe-4S binding protein [Candidatus Zymogenaceae bacterium]
MGVRSIIEINEDRCTGCGLCIIACAEGALTLVDGKARLVSDTYCDGLGACLGDCPEGAITIVSRKADPFDEEAVRRHLEANGDAPTPHKDTHEDVLACGCPGSAIMDLSEGRPVRTAGAAAAGDIPSTLGHWPVKLKLAPPTAPFLKGREIVLLADCAAAAYPDLHRKVLDGRAVVMGCPKFDDSAGDTERLSAILKEATPTLLCVVYMEVPCCHGYMRLAREAIARSGMDIPLRAVMIGRGGAVLKEETAPGTAGKRVEAAR